MANIDTADLSGQISKDEGVNGAQIEKEAEGSAKDVADEVAAVSKPSSPVRDATPALPSPGSGLVPLRGSAANGSSSGGPSAPTLSMPHPKKFSHSNINKLFLEKNSPASSTSQTPTSPTVNKPGSTIQKPSLQTASSHSRLVTAKLTAEGQRTTITGPGWSRPPSTSSSSTAPPSGSSKPAGLPGTVAAPQPPPAGNVIQPQPRGAPEASMGRKDSTGRPAWGTKTSASGMGRPDLTQMDFPTAAEVAQVRSAKMLEKKQAAQAVEAQKEALAAEADAFRGVHLAPNVHHWDEDEGDDSNFLDEVIEFDDGRQYTIPHQQAGADGSAPAPGQPEAHDVPVSKEERFADDFDRSWPRSRTSNAPPQQRVQPHLSPSSTSSQSLMHSPQDSSRVLFNERSNRLEPYSSHSQGRFGPPKDPYLARRGSRTEYTSSPTEMRNGRDAPPHTQGLQLLQKGSEYPSSSPWRDDSKPRDRRDFNDSSQPSRAFSHGFEHNHPRDHYNQMGAPPGASDRQRRFSNMGPPPLPSPGGFDSRETRQLPPHLSASQSPLMWRSSSSEADTNKRTPANPPSEASVPDVTAARSPVASLASLSPLHVESPLQMPSSTIPLVDIDEVRKAAMHSAAERARLRRQHEEEEREKERARARKKADEIEAKLKAAEEAKAAAQAKDNEAPKVAKSDTAEDQAVKFIEHAVESVHLHEEPSHSHAQESPAPSPAVAQRLPFTRGSSTRGGIRPSPVQRGPTSGISADTASPATEIESWRTKQAPSRSHAPPQSPSVSTAQPPPVMPPPNLPLMAEVESFDIKSGESFEVVDFADHGRLVGHEPPPIQSARVNGSYNRPPRPVATDFFEDKDDVPRSAPPHTKSDEGSWRRRASVSQKSEQEEEQEKHVPKEKPSLEITPAPYEQSPPAHWKGPVSADGYGRSYPEHGQPGHPSLRSPVTPSYREAPMSALTDTMARIKGALDGMHPKQLEPPRKWLPPALRESSVPRGKSDDQHQHEHHEELIHLEVFDVTSCDPPKSPKPAWNHFMVRLPRVSHPLEPVPFKRLRLFNTQTFGRSDVHSLEVMNRRDFNLNEALFRKPFLSKGRVKYIVSLPGSRNGGKQNAPRNFSPVVNLPSNVVDRKTITNTNTGAFGRPREADGVTSWRRAAKAQEPEEVPQTLNTTSRSPPPEAPSQALEKHERTSSPAVSVPPAKGRLQPKLPEGSAVAFYRDSRVNSSETQPKPTVSFIVNSELEEDLPRPDGGSETNGLVTTSQAGMSTALVPVNNSIVPVPFSSVNDPIVEFHKGTHSPIHAPITPRTQAGNLPWSKSPKALPNKDLSAEAEHLKTVWSTTANQSDKPSINSLGRIADDLTAPFPVRESKLEETATAPVPVRHPSKMSLSDVTRSFQQVPTSSGSSGNGDSRSVSNPTSPPALRQPNMLAQSQPPMMPVGMRPAYAGYPSPMMSSPSPNMMYAQAMTPSPIPRPMLPNAGSPQYPPQPMWVPMPPPGMMRPMPSPYGAQLMPYPASMYGPAPNAVAPQPNGVQGRPPGMVMSPVAAQAQANMQMSPVLMSAMPGMPGAGYPGPGGAGRGQPAQRGMYDGMPPMMQQSPSYGPQPPSYSNAPPNSYVRNGW